ncbi:hypothetical protein AGABI2DRAFT_137907 [Agaricus bisporus var. bisporus H97]|uniref:hypothetical protein n=1 Tax=Agaricus bisporus var. bisporus (strain H97 / ATCC MYA-4626 / FGSC 10389) TaxID=936046 RepID=UPI00029F71AA|nr:hypothetical protein AGABI2DRAFT_137907 [Agaricus bisporus var. bisporus H97]EKV45389.1 hypothetical protein AGABI2DRAFT_137907 [Agaricus bisporus var. bisporus H97]
MPIFPITEQGSSKPIGFLAMVGDRFGNCRFPDTHWACYAKQAILLGIVQPVRKFRP